MNVTQTTINETLQTISNTTQHEVLRSAMRHALLAGGKRLRPLLMLSVIEAYDIDPTPFINAACSLEMLHTYTLIHDDLPAMDNDDLRRGKPTTHKQFDEATAILAGDALLTDAFQLLARDENLSDTQSRQCTKILSSKSGSNGIIKGQMLDIAYENKQAPLGILQDIHYHKTANLIQAALMMGAAIAKPETLDEWATIGEKLGIAFQIQDDVLEATTNEQTMGKSLSDQRNQKSTYYSLLGKEKCELMLKDTFTSIDQLLNSLKLPKSSVHKVINIIKTRTN